MADPAAQYLAKRHLRNRARGSFDQDLASLRSAAAERKEAARAFALSHKGAIGGAAALAAGLAAAWLLRGRIGALLAGAMPDAAEEILDGED